MEYTKICKHNLVSRGFENVKVLNCAILNIPLMQHSWDTVPFKGKLFENLELVHTVKWEKLND